MGLSQNFSSPLHHKPPVSLPASIFNRRTAGLVVGGALLCAGIVAAARNEANLSTAPQSATGNTSQRRHTLQMEVQQGPPTDLSVSGEDSITSKNEPGASRKSQPSQSATVKVNGHDVPVPKNGTVHREYNGGNSQTSVEVSSSTKGKESNTSSSSFSVDISSESVSSGGTNVSP